MERTSSKARDTRRGWLRLASLPVALVVGLGLCELVLGLIAGWQRPTERASRSLAWPGEAETTLLCLGDSHTFGLRVEPTEAWPAQLEESLRARNVRVVNAGVSGIDSSATVERTPQLLTTFEPEVVLLSIGANNPECWRDGGGRRWYDRTRSARILRQAFPPPSEGAWNTERLAADVARVAALVEGSGARLVLVGYGADTGQFARTNRALRQIATDARLSFVECAAPMAELARERGAANVFFPDEHPRPSAHRRTAELVRAALAPRPTPHD